MSLSPLRYGELRRRAEHGACSAPHMVIGPRPDLRGLRTEAIGGLREQVREQVGDVPLQHGLHQVRVDAELAGDQARDAGWPVQQRVRIAPAISPIVAPRQRMAPILIRREPLRLDLKGELRDIQPGIWRAVTAIGSEGRAVRIRGFDQPAAGLVDVSPSWLAGNAAATLGLAQRLLADADASGGLSVQWGQLGHCGDFPPHMRVVSA